MIVDIMRIVGTAEQGAEVTLEQHPDRSAWNTVGASVQAGPRGGIGTPSKKNRITLHPATGVHTVLDELVALGDGGRVFLVLMTPTQVAAAVTAGVIPNS
jgi:hypothetical protein